MTPSVLSPNLKSTTSSPVASTSPLAPGKAAATKLTGATGQSTSSSSMKLNELISNATSSSNSNNSSSTTQSSNSSSIASLIQQQQQQQPMPINRQLTDTTNIKQHNQANVLTPASTSSLNSFLVNSGGANLINVANTMLINNTSGSPAAGPEGLIIQTPMLNAYQSSQIDELKSHKAVSKKRPSTTGSCQSILNSINKKQEGNNVDILKLIDLKSNVVNPADLASVSAETLKSLISASSAYFSIPIITSSLQGVESDANDEEETCSGSGGGGVKMLGVDVDEPVKQENEGEFMDENEAADAYETMEEEQGDKCLKTNAASSRCYHQLDAKSSHGASKSSSSSLNLQPQQHVRIIKSSRSNSIDQLIAAAAVTATQTCSSTATSPSPSPSSPSPSTSSVASSNASTLVSTPSTANNNNTLVQTVMSSQANNTGANVPSPSSSCSSTSSSSSSFSSSSNKQQQQQQQQQQHGQSSYSANDRNSFSRKGLNTIVEAIIHVEGKNLLDELVESASPTSSTSSTHSSSSISSLTGQNLINTTSTSITSPSSRFDDASPTSGSSLKNPSQAPQQQKPPKKRKYTTEDMANQQQSAGEGPLTPVGPQAQSANYHYISDYYNHANKAALMSSTTGSASPTATTAASTASPAQMCFIDINQLGTLLLNPQSNANNTKASPIVLNGDHQVFKSTTINILPNDISLAMLTTSAPSTAGPIALSTTNDLSDRFNHSRRTMTTTTTTSDTNNNNNLLANNNNNNSSNGGAKQPSASQTTATLQMMPT